MSTPGPSPNPGESLEQYEAEQDGFTVTVVDGTTWDSMTAAQFAAYQVIIIGDPTCGDATNFQAASSTRDVWEPVVMSSGGNKVLIGTDPTYHYRAAGHPNGNLLGKNGIAYAGAVAGGDRCLRRSQLRLLELLARDPGAAARRPELARCRFVHRRRRAVLPGSISIIAQSGPTSGLNDSDLSNWSCSVHEFFDKFPSDYTPLALATDPSVPVTYSGTDVEHRRHRCRVRPTSCSRAAASR